MADGMIGHYRIEARLGEGGVGEVFKATDTLLGRPVALKRLRAELTAREEIALRFQAEAQTLARLNHPNIATLYGLEHDGDSLVMVMEYVDGESVWSLVRRCGALPLDQAAAIFLQTLDGIGYVHARGVVHRDIKGSNLMLGRDTLLKVMDFGIARVLGSERMTLLGQLVGTPDFMSPEQVRGEEIDSRADIYSLGILLCLLLSGRLPFDAQSEYELLRAQVESAPLALSDIAPGLPAALDTVLARALAKRPGDRFADVESFRSALMPCLAGIDLIPSTRLRAPCLAALAGGDPIPTAAGAGPAPTRVLVQAEAVDAEAPTRERAPLAAPPRRRPRARLALVGLALVGLNLIWVDPARHEPAPALALEPEPAAPPPAVEAVPAELPVFVEAIPDPPVQRERTPRASARAVPALPVRQDPADPEPTSPERAKESQGGSGSAWVIRRK